MHKFHKISVLVTCAVLCGSGFWYWENNKKMEIGTKGIVGVIPESRQESEIDNISKEVQPVAVKGTEEKATEKKNPTQVQIVVPFSSQAPLGQWDAFHEEACEEASLLMLKYYLDGKTLTPEVAEKEIQAMLAYEIKHYGKYEDSDAQEIVRLAEDFYGLQNLRVVYDFSQEDLKKYLSLGRPIIVPAAGRLLGNPNFKAPGPLYHNLVLTGFDGSKIITNDPGTRKGQNYQYDVSVLYAAIHDFPGNLRDIEKGRKAMIVVE
jgi:hypothetical protein